VRNRTGALFVAWNEADILDARDRGLHEEVRACARPRAALAAEVEPIAG